MNVFPASEDSGGNRAILGLRLRRFRRLPILNIQPAEGAYRERLVIRAERRGKEWSHDGIKFGRVEAAAAAFLEADGYRVDHCENSAATCIMKAASLATVVPSNRIFEDFSRVASFFYESFVKWEPTLLDAARQEMSSIAPELVEANIRRIVNDPGFTNMQGRHDAEVFCQLYRKLGNENVVKIFDVFRLDPYRYRKGWPDLLAVKDGEVIVGEVKSPKDRISQFQKDIEIDILRSIPVRSILIEVVS